MQKCQSISLKNIILNGNKPQKIHAILFYINKFQRESKLSYIVQTDSKKAKKTFKTQDDG